MTRDPFGTAGLRAAVLRAWVDAPARFREDANAEEALALGGYADRALSELIGNGVDAALAAGVPARILVSWDPLAAELTVANTGSALTATGVAALSSLRASAKRDLPTVGHFGVGFTAVLGLTDRPSLHSRTAAAALGFDAAAVLAAVTAEPELQTELAARDGQVPVLRWPIPVAYREPPTGYETAVVLPIEPATAARLEQQLADVNESLLWALPGLSELQVEDAGHMRWWRREAATEREVTVASHAGSSRWAVQTTAGEISAELLADRPVEERRRSRWWIRWVRPLDALPRSSFVGAPVPTAEPLTLPAQLVGTFPVDDTRSRLAPGPLTAYLIDQAARGYVDLMAATAAADRPLLVPGADFPAGPVDGELTAAILAHLPLAPLWMTSAGDLVAAEAATVVDGVTGPAAALIGEAVPGLLEAPETAAARAGLLRAGVRSVALAAVVEELAALERAPQFWGSLYSLLAERSAEEMAAVPIPVIGGGRRIGARAVLVPDPDLPRELLLRTGSLVPELPVVHPDAVHPVLDRWGGQVADAAGLLAAPEFRQRLARFRDELEEVDPDPDDVTDWAGVVLDLLALDHTDSTVSDLVLTDTDDQPWPADELLQPEARLRHVLSDDERPTIHPRWTAWGPVVLSRAGVRDGFGVRQVDPAATDNDLPDFDDWIDDVGPVAGEKVAVITGLDEVAGSAWPAALRLLAADPASRAALVAPVAGGPSYGAWWIKRHARLAGLPLSHWRTAHATALVGLYDEVPEPLDPVLAVALGVLTTLADAVREDPEGLLHRWADPAIVVPPERVQEVTAAIRQVLEANDFPLPDGVRTATGAVVDVELAMVVDVPWPVQVLDAGRLVPGGNDPLGLADLLDLDLVSDLRLPLDSVAATAALDPALLARACAAAGWVDPPLLHPATMTVGPQNRPVAWWPADDGWWVDGSPAAVGSVVAWVADQWSQRHTIIAAAAGQWPDPTAGLVRAAG